MKQEQIGKFIAQMRKEKKMTQIELASKLGVTDRAVSNWENGRRLPDYSIIKDLCEYLGITINELFAGEKIVDEEFKEKADKNLLNILQNSAFTLKDKVKFYKEKWEREHFIELMIEMFVIVIFIIYGFIKNNDLQYLFILLGFIVGIIENKRMIAYIEKNTYVKKDISVDEFRKSITDLRKIKELINKFKTKKEAIEYLVKETKLPKHECLEVYDFIMNLDLNKINTSN